MNHEWKAEMDILHQAWPTAVRERDFDRQSSLIAHEPDLIREAAAVISAFHQLIAQKLMRTKAGRSLVDTGLGASHASGPTPWL